MPITIAAAYPSAAGGLQGCVTIPSEEDQETCIDTRLLEPPSPDQAAIQHDFEGQAAAYAAVLEELFSRSWLDGFISRGFYTPARIQDKSNSIYGKPAQEILSTWFHSTATGIPEE